MISRKRKRDGSYGEYIPLYLDGDSERIVPESLELDDHDEAKEDDKKETKDRQRDGERVSMK